MAFGQRQHLPTVICTLFNLCHLCNPSVLLLRLNRCHRVRGWTGCGGGCYVGFYAGWFSHRNFRPYGVRAV